LLTKPPQAVATAPGPKHKPINGKSFLTTFCKKLNNSGSKSF
jgi:hypothetical protein